MRGRRRSKRRSWRGERRRRSKRVGGYVSWKRGRRGGEEREDRRRDSGGCVLDVNGETG